MSYQQKQTAYQLTIGGDMIVNRLGYGAMHLTGYGMWGNPDDPEKAVRLLRRAVELGVNFIDTADCYGPGNNEQIIRRALHPYAEDLVICTKGGCFVPVQKTGFTANQEPRTLFPADDLPICVNR